VLFEGGVGGTLSIPNCSKEIDVFITIIRFWKEVAVCHVIKRE
jgi:hypothetical protein